MGISSIRSFSFVLCCLLFLSLGGCTKMLKTSEGRKFFKQTSSEITKVANRTSNDLKKKRAAIVVLKKDGADFSKAPYKSMENQVNEFSSVKKELNGHQKTAKALLAQYNETVGNKKTISEKHKKVWKKVMSLKKEAEGLKAPVESLGRKFGALQSKYLGFLKKEGIGTVKVAKIRKVFIDGFNALRPKAKDAKKRIDAAEKRMMTLRLPQHKKAQKRQVLQQMHRQRDLITKRVKQAKEVQQHFLKLAGDKKVIWSGPGTKIGKLKESMQGHIDGVKTAFTELNSLVKKFNKK